MTLLALPNRHQITIHKAQSQHSFSLHPMNTAQWPQENNTMVMRPLEEIVVMRKAAASSVVERKVRPHQKQEAVNCPRCNSTNTKFCYYNNYSLSQPRYFCKTCRRYWTEGGTLRNIPVGGGTRSKNKSIRSSSSNSSSTDSITSNNNINNNNNNNNNNININITSSSSSSLPQLQNPNKIHDDDLSLGFTTLPDFKTINELIQVPNFEENNSNDKKVLQTDLSATSMGLMSSFMPNNMVVYSSGFSVLPELIRPNNSDLNFDGLGNNYENLQGVQEAINGKVLFPFEDLKQGDSTTVNANDPHQKQGDSTTGFWNGVMGGEVSW